MLINVFEGPLLCALRPLVAPKYRAICHAPILGDERMCTGAKRVGDERVRIERDGTADEQNWPTEDVSPGQQATTACK